MNPMNVSWSERARSHEPRERVLVERIDEWEVRAFGAQDACATHLLRRGMGHLQLWNPTRAVSILTPSPLSCDLWELEIPGPVRHRFLQLPDLGSALRARGLPPPPTPDRLCAAYLTWVLEPSRRLLLGDDARASATSA